MLKQEEYQKQLWIKIKPSIESQNLSIDQITELITKGIQVTPKKDCSKIRKKEKIKLTPETIKLKDRRRKPNTDARKCRDIKAYRSKQILQANKNHKNF